jgi:hypothetical protein
MARERLIHFLGEVANLLMVLQQNTAADRLQMTNIVTKRESTMAKLAELLNEARELATLYDDLPGGEFYDSEN